MNEDDIIARVAAIAKPEMERLRLRIDTLDSSLRTIAAERDTYRSQLAESERERVRLDTRVAQDSGSIARMTTAMASDHRTSMESIGRLEREMADKVAMYERMMTSLRDGYKAVERRHNDILQRLERLTQMELREPPETTPVSPREYTAVVTERDGNGRALKVSLKPKET